MTEPLESEPATQQGRVAWRMPGAFAGDTVRAKMLADDLDKRIPEDTWVQFN